MHKPTGIQIPLSVPCLGPEEEQAVLQCVQSGWVSSASPSVKAFETAFANKIGSRFAIATNSGTAALHMAMLALNIQAGDEVIVPAMSFVATVNPVRYLGATPVFVDVESTRFGMNAALVESAITSKTKAIVVAHLYGFPALIRPIVKIAEKYNLPIIEDAAEALGASVDGDYVGTIGTIGCFSFNGNKTITCGGGGMIVTDDATLAERILHLSTQARESGLDIAHDDIGYNARMTGMQASLGLAQLAKLDRFVARKREVALTYAQELSLLSGIQTKYLVEPLVETKPSYWLSVALLEDANQRDRLIKQAAALGIEFRPFFKPINMLAPYIPYSKGRFPVAEELWRRGLCLPSCCSMSDEQQQEVMLFLEAFLGKKTEELSLYTTRDNALQQYR